MKSGALALVAACAALSATGACAPASRVVPGALEGGPNGIVIVPAVGRGLLVVLNDGPVHLTLELAGAELGVSEDDPAVWLVDGQIIEVAVVPRQAIYGAATPPASDQQLLLDHGSWEASYLAREVGGRASAAPRACRTARGARCLLSSYDLPRARVGTQAVRRSLLLTTVVADQVVGLASPVHAGDEVQAEARLRQVLETLVARDRWIDPRVERTRLQRR